MEKDFLKSVIAIGLLMCAMSTPVEGDDNCSALIGNTYHVGWTTSSVQRPCCYVGGNQWYYMKVQGANHHSFFDAFCGATAPCDSPEVPIESPFGQHIAKFAWRLDAYGWGTCPSTPATRWENLTDYNAGDIHASPNEYIGLFTNAGRVD